VEWVPVCPEVEVGLGVPREPIRLVGDARAPRLISESGKDLTERMQSWVHRRTGELAALDLAGYVLKSESPSCGARRVRVHRAKSGPPRRVGVGLFARGLRERFPLLPIEEESALREPLTRVGFVERIFAQARWQSLRARGTTAGDLTRFHAENELAVLAHGASGWRRLETVISSGGTVSFEATLQAYGAVLMAVLEKPITRRGHARVLRRILDRLSGALSAPEQRELRGLTRDYETGRQPLTVPLRRAREHARELGVESLRNQLYLNENSEELLL
jgi:uncharacterized protein YbbK (DUF523 family)/uncharacterized protein YbgA (DUF1722 family)